MMRRLALIPLAASLAGCSMKLAPRYDPAPMATGWEGRKPKIYLGSFLDKSTSVTITGAAASGRSATFARKPEEALKEAFAAQFARLGVPLVRSLAEADAQVSASWKETSVDLPAGFAVRDTAAVRLGIVVKTPANAVVFSDEVVGKGQGPGLHPGCCPGNNPARAVDAAFTAAMAAFEELFIGEISQQIFRAQAPGLAQAAPAPRRKSDVDDVPAFKAERRRAHAVVIGVETYRQNLPPADFAASDARLMAKYLQADGFPAENVAVLTNDGATRGDLEKYLERWLHNRVEPGDSVFVYYSGHGAPNPATGDAYLLPFDGDPMYLDQTAFPVQRLYGALAKLPTKNVTVVLDSCFSGSGGRSVIAKGARPLVSVKDSAVPPELTVLSAAAGNQISQSYQDEGHGLFTYFFLKGLGRQASAGTFDMRKVFEYAAPEVSRVARQEYNTEQHPQWRGSAQ